ncbi:hypothetical protein N7448_011176 [Penicillium atrosanguineum]|nr:hypothetical protein N7448_011176 [Penicillium atrosanguineum]
MSVPRVFHELLSDAGKFLKLALDEEILDSTAMLAGAYRLEGRWGEAEQLEVQVMETRKTKLGADHPDTLTSMANLAHTLRSSGQDIAALLLMDECVRLRDRKLGRGHPHAMSPKSTSNEWRVKADSPSS